MKSVQKENRREPVKVNGTNIYKTYRHQKAAASWIAAHPYCQECSNAGISTLGKILDHIIPISMGGHPWLTLNYQTLCTRCHAIKSGKEAHGIVQPWVLYDGYKIPK